MECVVCLFHANKMLKQKGQQSIEWRENRGRHLRKGVIQKPSNQELLFILFNDAIKEKPPAFKVQPPPIDSSSFGLQFVTFCNSTA